MVIKLIKRDFKDSMRYYGPMQIMIITLFVALGVAIQTQSSNLGAFSDIIGGLAIISIFGVILGLFIMSLLANIYILYTSVYGDRGYDLFTMPVTSFQIIAAKLLTIILWTVISGLVAYFGMFIFLIIIGEFNSFMQGIKLIVENFDVIFLGLLDSQDVFLVLLSGLVAWLFTSVLILFVGAAVNTSKIQKNRGVIAFVLYYAINFLVSLVMQFGMITTGIANNEVLFSAMLPSIIFRLSLMGIMIFAVRYLWENKLEVL